MQNQTIFITIPWFYPAFKAGGPVQSVINLVAAFHPDIRYKIFCGNTDLNNEALLNIEAGKWIYYNDYTEIWYAMPKNRSEILLEQLKKNDPAVLFIIGIYDWHFNLVPLIFAEVEKKIISVRGMLHPGALSVKPIKKKMFLLAWKILGLHKKAVFHVTDNTEKKYTERIFGNNIKIMVAGNFPRFFCRDISIQKNSGSLRLVSIGIISPMKNYLFILKALTDCREHIEYNIYGEIKDDAYWQLCREQIRKLPENINVIYKGIVQPDLVKKVLFSHHVFIMPSKSENFGHAIIEALSAGLPVITSFNTPWNQLEQNHAGVNVQENINDVSNAITFFADMNNEIYKKWSHAASLYAKQRIDHEELQEAYTNLFK